MSSEERNLFRYAADEAEVNDAAAQAAAQAQAVAAEHQAYLTAQAAQAAAQAVGGPSNYGSADVDHAQAIEDESYRQHQQYPEDVASAAVRAAPSSNAAAFNHHMAGAGSLGAGSQMDDDESGDKKGKGKRQRVHYSCTECHRRKQKCDRKTPCQHCIARKVPERCKTFQPGEETDEMAQRLNRLERNVEDGFARLTQLIESNIVGAAAGQVMHASASQQQQQQAAYGAYPSYQQSILPPPPNAMQARYSGIPGPASEVDDVVNDGGQLSPKTGTFAASGATNMRVDTLLDKLSGHPGTTKDPYRAPEFMNIDEAMSEYGATLSVSYSLVAALPPRHLAEALLNHWYEDVNWIRVPIEQKRLRKDFDDLWASGPSLTTGNLNTYAVLVLILALATLSFPRSEAFPEDPRLVRLTARRLHFAGRRALLVSGMLGRQDIDNVVAWTLSGRYCIIDSRISEGWNSTVNAVCAAWVVGLHRDGSQLGLSPEVSEVRRQVWGMVFWLERALAMNLGRPTMINEAICDVRIPDDRNGEDYLPKSMTGITVPGLPRGLAQPTVLSYSRYRHELCVFVGRLINSYQNVQSPAHYSDILAIEAELETFQKNLPIYFKSTVDESATLGEERPVDTTSPLWLVIHRYSLTSDINFLRGALHRPYLLRSHGGKAGARFMPSRRAAIAAAHHDILSRHDFVRTIRAHFAPNKVPMGYHLHLGSQKYFSACLTLGIAALMDPHVDDALVWRAHLQAYLERAKAKAGSLAADASQREARIIELFLARIDDMRAGKQAPYQGRKRGREAGESEESTPSTRRAGKSRRTVDEEGDAHATAGLLLGLGRGDERTSQLSYSQLAGMSSSTASPGGSTNTPGTSHNASADEAQQLFEHWYRTEFAAGGSVSESVFTDHMDGGGLAGFDKLVSTSVSGLPSLPSAPMAPLPPPASGNGAPTSNAYSTAAQVALSDIAATNSTGSSGAGLHYATLPAPAWGNVPQEGTNANFDPSFWENLMDKISSTRTTR